MSDGEILKRVTELKSEMFNLKFSKHTTGVENPNKIKEIKKDIAKMLTAKNAKKHGAKK